MIAPEPDYVWWLGWATQALIHVASSDDHEEAVGEAKSTLSDLLGSGVPYGRELRGTMKRAARPTVTSEPARRIPA